MLTIGIVDDGVGVFPTLYKLRQSVCANYLCLVDKQVDFSCQNKGSLIRLANGYVKLLQQKGCDAVVFSSVDLSVSAYKVVSAQNPDYAIFSSEAPINHASTYTISNVLVVGSNWVKYLKIPNVLPCPMVDFPRLAQIGNFKDIVAYVTQITAPFDGKFDCIALAHSTMNLYKNCFSRVFPNVQIFDSLEGVARRLRKKYKKHQQKEDTEITFIDALGNDITNDFVTYIN